MKYLFYFISFIFPALCSSAQPAERDSSIYIASSRLYRMGESLVVSMQVDITRQIPSNESVILIPRLSDSLDNFIQLPAIYVNGRKQHIFFQRETGRQEKDYEELRRRNDRKQSVHYFMYRFFPVISFCSFYSFSCHISVSFFFKYTKVIIISSHVYFLLL